VAWLITGRQTSQLGYMLRLLPLQARNKKIEPAMAKAMVQAFQRGHLTWHALA